MINREEKKTNIKTEDGNNNKMENIKYNTRKNDKRKSAVKPIILNTILGIILYLIFFITKLIKYGLAWSKREYGKVPFSQLIFHIKVPLEGTSDDMIDDFLNGFKNQYRGTLIVALVVIIVCMTVVTICRDKLIIRIGGKNINSETDKTNRVYATNQNNKNRTKQIKISFCIKVVMCICGMYLLGDQLIAAYRQLGIKEYIKDMKSSTKVYDDYFVETGKVKITFPDRKKNLIYIYCESLELTYLLEKDGGAMKNDLMPNLTKIAFENESFSGNGTKLNGGFSASNCGWTIAGMVAQTAGIPLSIPIDGNKYGEYSKFLPKVTSLGDILQEQGYNQMLMIGSDAVFGGRKNYFQQHGNYEIFDLSTARERGYIEPDYYVHWGYEDEKLFSYARIELERLAQEDVPFNFTLLTVDTHFPDGYVCDLCENEFEYQYENVIACSDRQISDFIEWIKLQDFYEDTVVIVSGDHTSMSTTVETLMQDKNYKRRVYTAILNSDKEYIGNNERIYTTMDLFPTTLASMGCTIEGDRLGLGTNLYSDKDTLAEMISIDKLNEELFKMSNYYNKNILGE